MHRQVIHLKEGGFMPIEKGNKKPGVVLAEVSPSSVLAHYAEVMFIMVLLDFLGPDS